MLNMQCISVLDFMKSGEFHGLPLNAKYPVYFGIWTKC